MWDRCGGMQNIPYVVTENDYEEGPKRKHFRKTRARVENLFAQVQNKFQFLRVRCQLDLLNQDSVNLHSRKVKVAFALHGMHFDQLNDFREALGKPVHRNMLDDPPQGVLDRL